MNPLPTPLVLEDGRSFFGRSFGAGRGAFGGLVFSTGMSDYRETLTDPSYRGQVVLATTPYIGSAGWNGEDNESTQIQVAGYVVRNLAPRPSNWRSRRSLDAELADQGIVRVCGIDTRALTRHIRSLGTIRAGISIRELNPDRPRARVLEQPVMTGVDLCGEVSTPEARIVPAVGERRFTVAAVNPDIRGITPTQMAGHSMEVHVLPASMSFEKTAALEPDGTFFSNDPGSPATAGGPVTVLRQVLAVGIPYFRIYFGGQLLGRALKFDTYKLKSEHRGINQPVLDHATGKVEITSQNHRFTVNVPLNWVVDTELGQAGVSRTGLNDDVAEGLELRRGEELVTFSVQYHPEAATGPHDTSHLFDRFADLMRSRDAR